MRAELLDRQKDVLRERREDATAEKRSQCDLEYRELIDAQKDERRELIDRKELGLRSRHLLDRAYPQRGGEGRARCHRHAWPIAC